MKRNILLADGVDLNDGFVRASLRVVAAARCSLAAAVVE
jgi:hypothetical protein